MKILNAVQIREADTNTIQVEKIASHELMERAAKAFTNTLLRDFTLTKAIYIICGTGNNGGDGLCIARHLFLKGYDIKVFIVGDIQKASPDFLLNYKRLNHFHFNTFIHLNDTNLNTLENGFLYVDAIFGTGLNKQPETIYKKVIYKINEEALITISVDVPSGLFIDGPTISSCIKAHHIYTFQFPKLAFLFPENAQYAESWKTIDIGLKLPDIKNTDEFSDKGSVLKLIRPRNKFDHKGSYGHALIIAGNAGMEGAASLCGKSCLVTGSGLVTLCSDAQQFTYPELMHISLANLKEAIQSKKYNVVAIGPGLGNNASTKKILETVFDNYDQPVVLDADALNVMGESKDLLNKIPLNSILTPHPKEFERLFGKTDNSFQQLELQKTMSKKYSCFIVLKRAYTCITTPDEKVYFNSTGNAGMATAGSGDVLTGMITALLAQKYTSEHAAITATYLHGYAADIFMQNTNGQNMNATDIIGNIQKTFSEVVNGE
ncbi:MAG: NAD(P)H-hydrate dehydratase [Fimbriimonadaceae bacterium]|nr:NAD(P)H-hydrate dehydratase [Chitinophagales bacterium]